MNWYNKDYFLYNNMLLRNYKYRIYPTSKQKLRLEKQFEICKDLHNELLGITKETYECSQVSVTTRKDLYELIQFLKTQRPQYKGYSQVLQNVGDKLNKSYKAFYRRIKEKQNGKRVGVGYPRFKKKLNSLTYPQNNGCFKFKNQRRLQISQIGSVPIELHRIPKGTPKTLNIKKTPSNKWFATFSCEFETKIVKHKYPNNRVGIDLGLENFATLSDGTVIDNPRFLKKAESKLKKEHRRLSKKKMGSNNKDKQRIKLARCYETLTNQRMGFLHKLSHHITQHYSFISIEDLGVSNMVRNHYLAKSISDVGWSIFTGMLTYKVSSTGSEKVEVDRFYPSSQLCRECGNQQKMPLSKRIYNCDNCGAIIPRDENASTNILEEGLRKNTAGKVEIHACGDLTSTDKSKDLSASQVGEAGTICDKP